MDTTALLLGVVVALVTWWVRNRLWGKKSLPGPYGLPIVGYIPFLTWKPHIKLEQLSKKYGPMYRIQLGSLKVIILSDFKLIKEAFSDEAYIGRPPESPFDLSDDTMRTGAVNGIAWKEQRKFTIHTLRNLGLEKTAMEEHIRDEIQDMLRRLEVELKWENGKSEPIKFGQIILPSVSNNISSFIFGRRMEHTDPKRIELDGILNDIALLAGAVAWQLFFPSLGKFLKWLNFGSQAKMGEVLDRSRNFFRKEIASHEASLDPNNIRDFMDGYLLEIEKRKGNPNTSFTKNVLTDLSGAFFGAGSGTVRMSVEWVVLVCAGHPDVQDRILAEVEEVVGHQRFPCWADHTRMPYTEAVICEIMRWRSIVPLNFLRYTLENTELNGYPIPKHSRILANLHAVAQDKNLWGPDTDQFRPERFLSADGTKLVKPEYFIPFSIGKRACPGKNLAEIEVFLYVAAIIQKFQVSLPPGKVADYEGILGIGLEPKKQDLCLTMRQS